MQVKPNVILIEHTPKPELVVATAARLCYSPDSIEEVMNNLTEDKVNAFVTKLKDLHHESPFEHMSFTFGISGVSRALSHQLVRHRIASYSQKSQRYVNEGQFGFVIPPSIESDVIQSMWFIDYMKQAQAVYDKLVKSGALAEDARFVLPNACETQLIMTMNVRELWNFFKHRCCNRAQWEIRAIAYQILKLCKGVSPTLFANSGASCVSLGYCPDNAMQCTQKKLLIPTHKEILQMAKSLEWKETRA